jgi:GWxTD domain-containing protein
MALSLATRALTFVREGDQYRAEYTVTADFRQNGVVVYAFEATEVVQVAGYKETARTDESVIFQQFFNLAPGTYALALRVRDKLGSRTGVVARQIVIPTIQRNGFSSVIYVHEAMPRSGIDSLPKVVASPRSMAVFGRDTILAAYVETCRGVAGDRIQVAIRDDNGAEVWSDTAVLDMVDSVASGTIRIPVSRLEIGAMSMVVSRMGSSDSTQASLFISFGADLPVASFEDMLGYLTLYASPRRLSGLRNASSSDRASSWAAFLRETDPVPETSQHEGLRAYFARIEQANQDFREQGLAGWRTDRGRVSVVLGPPDNIIESTRGATGNRHATQIWEYPRFQLRLVFVDQTGFDQWRLTSDSEAGFQTVMRRELIR